MAGLSYITTSPKASATTSLTIPTDESIGAMLFDISGFDNPFDGYPLMYNLFKNGTIQSVKSIDDAVMLGIAEESFLNGMFYYHLTQFYDIIGENQTVYICFADCSKDWDILQSIQQQAKGKIFQIGVWTSQPIWNLKSDGSYGFTSLISDLQAQANEINGEIGTVTHSTIPLSIVLFGNSNYIKGVDSVDYKKLPDALVLDCPKVSVVLAQNGSDEIHQMQESNPNQAPVSTLGATMGLLAIIGAEASIACTDTCDLNVNEQFNNPEWGFGDNHNPIGNITYAWANTIAALGYIIPISYEALEASYFFSSDQTLSDGDFNSISRNRTMHKCRRALCTALLAYMNDDLLYDSDTKTITYSAQSAIADDVFAMLEAVTKNRQGYSQIDGRTIEFVTGNDILNDDSLSIRLKIVPADSSSYISEEVAHDTE